MGESLVFDVETDGLEATKAHCMVIIDTETGETTRYREHDGTLEDGLVRLQEADELIGHNIIGYDLPTLSRVYGCQFRGNYYDTMVAGQLFYGDIRGRDYARPGFPRNLAGSHALKAWGHRLGILKGDYGTTEDAWSHWSQAMEDYCAQDTNVTLVLWRHLKALGIPDDALLTEQNFYDLMCRQQRHGFTFDRQKAEAFLIELTSKRDTLVEDLQRVFPPKLIPYKRPYRGKTHKEIPFNPGSRQQIAERLMAMGWKPVEYTPTGQVKVDEPTLHEIAGMAPEAQVLADYLVVQKRLSQLSEGKGAWLKMVGDDERMHGRVKSCGATVSHRCAHSGPNMAQVPAVRALYGETCRGLFRAADGYALVGGDVSGLELRVLGHYLGRWDGGAYAEMACRPKDHPEGEIHTYNQHKAGLPTRDAAKTFIYAFIYGAGNQKLGTLVGGGEREGAAMRQKFMREIPGLKQFIDGVKFKAKTARKLRGIDGRILYPRSAHSAVNLLIQSTGAIVVKKATLIFETLMNEAGLLWGHDYAIVAHIHDEWQVEVLPEHIDLAKQLIVTSIVEAGKYYNLRCPLTGEAKSGITWADTH